MARFQLACTRLWWSGPRNGTTWALDALADVPATAREAEAARALIDIAEAGDDGVLRHLLRPDPACASVSWTVACYRIGDLVPDSLRDFADPVGAVTALEDCGDPDHVAAELVASTPEGLCWVALVRAGTQVRFQPFGAQSVLSRPGRHALSEGQRGPVENAAARWAQVLAWWSTSQASKCHGGEWLSRTGDLDRGVNRRNRAADDASDLAAADADDGADDAADAARRRAAERSDVLAPQLPGFLDAKRSDGGSLVEVSTTLHELASTVAAVAAAVGRLERTVEEISNRLVALDLAATAAPAPSTARVRRAAPARPAASAGRAAPARPAASAGRAAPARPAASALGPAVSAAAPAVSAVSDSPPAGERSEESAHRWWVPRHRTVRWRAGNVGIGDPAGESL
jgi:hypothetical protein